MLHGERDYDAQLPNSTGFRYDDVTPVLVFCNSNVHDWPGWGSRVTTRQSNVLEGLGCRVVVICWDREMKKQIAVQGDMFGSM